jgi:hypothetical protein
MKRELGGLFVLLTLLGLLFAVPMTAEEPAPEPAGSEPSSVWTLPSPTCPSSLATPEPSLDFVPEPRLASECYCIYWDPMFCERRIGPHCSCNPDTCGCDCA